MSFEIETKLSASDNLVLPPINLTAAGLRKIDMPTKRTLTTYFDTEDFDLFSCGAALRFRRSAGAGLDETGIWTLKFGPPAKGYTSSRSEFEIEASGRQVPKEFVPALAVFGAALEMNELASLAAVRRIVIFEAADGLPVIELDDDLVEIVDGPNKGLRFREIEVEHRVDGFGEQCEQIVQLLLSAGASYAESSSKLEQALENRQNHAFFSKLLARYENQAVGQLSLLACLVLENFEDSEAQMKYLAKVLVTGLQEESVRRFITGLVSRIAECGPLSGGKGSGRFQVIDEQVILLSEDLRNNAGGHLKSPSLANLAVDKVSEFVAGKALSYRREARPDLEVYADLLADLANLPKAAFHTGDDMIEAFIGNWS